MNRLDMLAKWGDIIDTHPWRVEGKTVWHWMDANQHVWFVTPEQIVERAVAYALSAVPPGGGIYFLVSDDGEVLYVGKSKYMQQRLKAHKKADAIPFARVLCLEMPDGAIDEVEKMYFIWKLPYNVAGVRCS